MRGKLLKSLTMDQQFKFKATLIFMTQVLFAVESPSDVDFCFILFGSNLSSAKTKTETMKYLDLDII